jgi:SAM-dependent methyltransferase
MVFTINSFNEDKITGITDNDKVIEMFVGDRLVAMSLPYTLDDSGKFHLEFRNVIGSIVGIDDINFRMQGSLYIPEVDEKAIGFIRRNVNIEKILLIYYRSMINYPEVPQHLLNYIGSGDAGQIGYRSIGFAYFYYLLKFIGIQPNCYVLDIGCGVGRIGLALAPYLKIGGGRYYGYDTWIDGIEWAQQTLSPLFPELGFHALASPQQGRRKGYLAEYAASIDIKPESIDLAISTSLFTHLKKKAYIDYLKQIRNALKPNGIALITTFLITPEEGDWIRKTKSNDEDENGLYVIDDTYADSYLWEENFFVSIQLCDLTICRYLPGAWRKRMPGSTLPCIDNFQDILILKRLESRITE